MNTLARVFETLPGHAGESYLDPMMPARSPGTPTLAPPVLRLLHGMLSLAPVRMGNHYAIALVEDMAARMECCRKRTSIGSLHRRVSKLRQ
ncbi:hypothetical protein LMG28614_04768 [Paraburkholderia ultramafica]|uniref:Uncharacterized protein n=1 Tax=Paraburkholderia ultramafica TaxID=1544867 RepID=A0A6S7CV11_9BURK|nr:hypothetical protein LMG28614_04768 [Paraburkholderia ultramafica]